MTPPSPAAPPPERTGGPAAPGGYDRPGIEVVRGDLTAEHVDAIVNAANSSLLGGGGVDGAIHRAAGPDLLEACRVVRAERFPDGLPVGEAVATMAGDLPCRYVIHTVGPDARVGQRDPGLLASCFRRSLDVAADLGCRTVAFPAVSAGVYGWAAEDVARVAVRTVLDHPRDGIEVVRFVLFSDPVLAAFRHALTAQPGGGTAR